MTEKRVAALEQELSALRGALEQERCRSSALEEELRLREPAWAGQGDVSAWATRLLGGDVTPPRSPPPFRWRKIVYERQPCEDNYVPDSFLASLETNRDPPPPRALRAVCRRIFSPRVTAYRPKDCQHSRGRPKC